MRQYTLPGRGGSNSRYSSRHNADPKGLDSRYALHFSNAVQFCIHVDHFPELTTPTPLLV